MEADRLLLRCLKKLPIEEVMSTVKLSDKDLDREKASGSASAMLCLGGGGERPGGASG